MNNLTHIAAKIQSFVKKGLILGYVIHKRAVEKLRIEATTSSGFEKMLCSPTGGLQD